MTQINPDLLRIEVATSAKIVDISNSGYTGFDGMFINAKGNVVGITNNGTSPGGNRFIELSGTNDWKSANVINSKEITASTTVAVTPDNKQYVINQDFSNDLQKTWTIEQSNFRFGTKWGADQAN